LSKLCGPRPTFPLHDRYYGKGQSGQTRGKQTGGTGTEGIEAHGVRTNRLGCAPRKAQSARLNFDRPAQQRSAEAPGRGPEASARAVRERLVGLIGTGSRTFTEHSSRLSGLVKKRGTPPNLHRFGGASRTTGPPTGGRLPDLSAARAYAMSYDQPRSQRWSRNHKVPKPFHAPCRWATRGQKIPRGVHAAKRAPRRGHAVQPVRTPARLQASRTSVRPTPERRNDVHQQEQRETLPVGLAKDPARDTQHSRTPTATTRQLPAKRPTLAPPARLSATSPVPT
jgi:hypothetical protein